jgi:hypothetical protein
MTSRVKFIPIFDLTHKKIHHHCYFFNLKDYVVGYRFSYGNNIDYRFVFSYLGAYNLTRLIILIFKALHGHSYV